MAADEEGEDDKCKFSAAGKVESEESEEEEGEGEGRGKVSV